MLSRAAASSQRASFAAVVNRRARWVVLGGSVGAVLIPAVLQLTGVLDSPYIFEDGSPYLLTGTLTNDYVLTDTVTESDFSSITLEDLENADY